MNYPLPLTSETCPKISHRGPAHPTAPPRRTARSRRGSSAVSLSRYSYRSATIGSTRAALLAGIQHAITPVASNNKTVLAKVAGS